MKIIGITGQTGAGKSTVCKKLTEYGCYHINADLIARELTEKGSPVISVLCENFGNDILLSDGSVDRKLLAQRAFSSPEKTLLLNSITHPVVTEKIRDIIDKKKQENCNAVLIDAIALFESGENDLCDFTISVVAPVKIRLERIIARDNISKEAALLRINAQKGENYYREKADYIIENYPPHNIDDEIKRIFTYE